MSLMPCFFLAHGSPINAIEDNYFVDDWKQLAQNTPRPKAIIVFSAHWHVAGTRISSQLNPPTLHDFGGFPERLYQQQYPCPGSPALAQAVQQQLAKAGIKASLDDNWGLDHGAWVLLKHLYPQADIPVLQISLDAKQEDLTQHFAIGRALKSLRQQGILLIGSGNIVHNIAKWFRSQPNDSIAWAKAFDQAIAQAIIARDIATLAHYQQLPYASEAVPSVEHYLPLLYCMGFSDEHDKVQFSRFAFEDLSTACSRSVRWG